MTLIAYDCEFFEDGERINLISIGLVADDGREYYAVSAEIDEDDTQRQRDLKDDISCHEWLMTNVISHLPLAEPPAFRGYKWLWRLDWSSALVKPRRVIANEVRDFILGARPVELWADYAAYDHVALAQLWGSMMRLPEGIPMWTNDLRQEIERLGVAEEIPAMPGITAHNALDDAREVMHRLKWLREHEHAKAIAGDNRG